jgi:hypothetical protein
MINWQSYLWRSFKQMPVCCISEVALAWPLHWKSSD